MEIKIGIKDVAREVVIDSAQDPEEIVASVSAAIENKTLLKLVDSKGKSTLIPGESLGYVEIGAEAKRHIGFGPFSEA
ncbi:DUF3107 domain-containing protein [Rothia sp. AR01]|uniref:DUF3107 domain-containing protein n=1 Tax=Rothia santali TaxID=2949643 RepID=A0A9X2HI11_9MICC|nr:DUF3107 domain-containing protein [Rothia santali]MCP3426076.1 DUF3107 domain-containing protein [Rothia santali]